MSVYPVVYVPEDEELEHNLAATRSITQRMEYVKSLLEPVRDVARMQRFYERTVEEERAAKESMTEELRNLRQKLGKLDPAGRNALDQRYDMLGKIKRARGQVPAIRQQMEALLDELEEALRE